MAGVNDKIDYYKSELALPNISLIYKLQENNYLKLSQLVKTTLKGKWKVGQLIEEPLEKVDLNFQKWDTKYSAIIA